MDGSASNGLVARNQIYFGGDCYQIDSSNNVIFEQNVCLGINLFSRGSAAGSTYGGPAASFIYFAQNHIKFVLGGDQEELTLDGGYAPYFGTVTPGWEDPAEDSTVATKGDAVPTITMHSDPHFPQRCSEPGKCQMVNTNWTGAAVYVLAGQGVGQLRTVRGGGITYNRTWQLTKSFGGSGGGVPLGCVGVGMRGCWDAWVYVGVSGCGDVWAIAKVETGTLHEVLQYPMQLCVYPNTSA